MCVACSSYSPTKPFALPAHDDCVSAGNCPTDFYSDQVTSQCVPSYSCSNEYYADLITKTCKFCSSSSYILPNHSSLVYSPSDCGNGSAIVNSSCQCYNCSKIDQSKPFASVTHKSCVAASDCDFGTFGNTLTNQCEACPADKFILLNRSSCISSKADCGAGIIVFP